MRMSKDIISFQNYSCSLDSYQSAYIRYHFKILREFDSETVFQSHFMVDDCPPMIR